MRFSATWNRSFWQPKSMARFSGDSVQIRW